jgi:hypothetical protein
MERHLCLGFGIPHLEAVTISKRIELQQKNKKDSESLFRDKSIAAT